MRGFQLTRVEEPHTWRTFVDSKSVYFAGHFPDLPILPAVVPIANMILPLARRAFAELGPLKRVFRARFRKPIFPGQELLIRLRRDASVVAYEIHCEGELAASAQLHFAAAEAT